MCRRILNASVVVPLSLVMLVLVAEARASVVRRDDPGNDMEDDIAFIETTAEDNSRCTYIVINCRISNLNGFSNAHCQMFPSRSNRGCPSLYGQRFAVVRVGDGNSLHFQNITLPDTKKKLTPFPSEPVSIKSFERPQFLLAGNARFLLETYSSTAIGAYTVTSLTIPSGPNNPECHYPLKGCYLLNEHELSHCKITPSQKNPKNCPAPSKDMFVVKRTGETSMEYDYLPPIQPGIHIPSNQTGRIVYLGKSVVFPGKSISFSLSYRFGYCKQVPGYTPQGLTSIRRRPAALLPKMDDDIALIETTADDNTKCVYAAFSCKIPKLNSPANDNCQLFPSEQNKDCPLLYDQPFGVVRVGDGNSLQFQNLVLPNTKKMETPFPRKPISIEPDENPQFLEARTGAIRARFLFESRAPGDFSYTVTTLTVPSVSNHPGCEYPVEGCYLLVAYEISYCKIKPNQSDSKNCPVPTKNTFVVRRMDEATMEYTDLQFNHLPGRDIPTSQVGNIALFEGRVVFPRKSVFLSFSYRLGYCKHVPGYSPKAYQ
eukprot:Nk52_evm2s454 gene=Nk52_evmTU2s454